MKHVIATALFLLLTSCAEVSRRDPRSSQNTQSVDSPATASTKVPAAAEEAVANFDSQPSLTSASSDLSTTLKLPGFRISYTKADYVQMLRCAKSYKFKAANGKDVSELLTSNKASREDLRSAWMNAWASFRECNIVGDNISRDNFVDFTAGNKTALEQSFYYVINPCLRTEHLIDASEPCSFNLKVTLPITYTATHEASFLAATANLSKMEDKLSATFGKLQFLAGDYRYALEVCDFNYQQQVAAEARKQGIAKLVGLGVNTVMSAFMMGASPVFLAMKNNVGSIVAQAFAGKPANITKGCPNADAKLQEAQALQNTLNAVIDEVQLRRNEIANLNIGYAKLDVSNKSSNFSLTRD